MSKFTGRWGEAGRKVYKCVVLPAGFEVVMLKIVL